MRSRTFVIKNVALPKVWRRFFMGFYGYYGFLQIRFDSRCLGTGF